jgi:hypothetical protein
MTIAYSTNLGLINITTGTESGLWGNYTNTNICTLIEQAISGYATQAITDGADTVINITSGAASAGRNAALKLTGTLTAARNLVVPTVQKLYYINNATSGGFAVTVKTSGGSGIVVPNGKSMILLVDGANVVEAITYFSGFPVGANPTSAAVGLSPVNGTATTFMRSDAAPPLDVTIAPTWTGAHTFSNTVTFNGTVAGTGLSSYLGTYLATPGAIGGTTPAAGTFTTLIAKKAYTVPVALGTAGVISSSCAPDCSQSNVFYCTTTAGTAFTVAPTNPSDGQTINIFITQGGASASTWTATWAKWPGGSSTAVLSVGAGVIDLVVATYRNTTWYATLSKAFS